MLDRPVPFNDRLRMTWPTVSAPDAAIDRALQAMALAPSGSQRRVAPASEMRSRRPRTYSAARCSGAF